MATTPLPNEQELLAKVAEGNKTAFENLFKHYHKYVFDFSKKITHSEEMAREIVQDIFLKLWLNREKMDGLTNFGAYLNRIVRNHSFNILRQLSQELKSNHLYSEGKGELDDTTRREIDYRETESILNEAIATLSPQQRKVYILCHQQGLKYEEAAQEMSISPQTVHAYMKDALAKIRLHFKKNAIQYSVLIGCLFK